MRVLFVSSSSGSRGGGELYLPLLAGALAKHGVEVGLWASTHSRMDELCSRFAAHGSVIRDDYVNTYDRKLRVFGRTGGEADKILESWKGWQPDILHVNKQNLEDGLDLLEMANAFPGARVCTVHLTQPARFLGAKMGRIRDWWSAKLLRRFKGSYIVVDDSRRPDLAHLVGNGNQVHVIRNGVVLPDTEELAKLREAKRGELGLASGEKLVIAVGRLWEQKRPMLFLEWSRSLRAEGFGDRFLWIGEGFLQGEWDVVAGRLGSWIGRIGWQSDVLPYLAAADCLLHPARYEGLSFGILEAMAAGLPCVLSEEVCEGSFAQMGEDYYVRASPGWESRLRATDLAALGERARNKIKEEFSLEKMSSEYLELYSRLPG